MSLCYLSLMDNNNRHAVNKRVETEQTDSLLQTYYYSTAGACK